MTKEKKEIVEETLVQGSTNPPKSAVEIMLEKIQADMAELRKESEAKDEKINMLISIADESRKDKFDAKNKKIKIVPRVKLTTLNGKVVVGSKTLIDEVYKDLSDAGKWVEKQIHCYTLEDGTSIDLPLPQYTRIREKIDADVIKIVVVPEKEGDNGETFYRYTVKVVEDGRELTVDAPYLN